jgi:integrase
MSIFAEKRNGVKTGTWIVEVNLNGKRRKGRFSRIQDARKQEVLWLNGAHDDPRTLSKAEMSLDRWAKEGRAAWKGQRDEAQSCQRFEAAVAVLKQVMTSHGKAPMVDQVDLWDLQAFKEAIKAERNLKPASVNRYTRVVTRALGWAHSNKYRGPVPKIENEAETDKPFFVLSDDQETALRAELERAGAHNVLVVMDAQLMSGARIGEIIGCQTKGKVKAPIAASDIDVSDTNRKVAFLTLRNTKNGDTRLGTVPYQIGCELRAMAESQTIPTYRVVHRALRNAREALGLSTFQPTHAHRHTVVTRLVEMGENSLKVMKYVGHKNLRTTEKYFHQSKTAKVDVMESLMNRRSA